MIDIGIIGAGPAGLSAAINAVARNKKPVVFGRKRQTSWLYKAEKINNHLGMSDMSGPEMIDSFYEHATKLGVEIKEGRVLQVIPMGSHFSINFENEIFEAKTIIITTGASKSSSILGESEYVGKGVSYCATCDGMLYRGKDVVVYGEMEEGEEDADFLSEICNKVYYIHSYDGEMNLKNDTELIKDKIKEIRGGDFVTEVSVGDRTIACDGVFIVKESTPMDNIVFGLELEANVVKVNKYMETNLAGVFAAGDCTGWPLQVSNAVGEGLVAAQQAVKYINKKDNDK